MSMSLSTLASSGSSAGVGAKACSTRDSGIPSSCLTPTWTRKREFVHDVWIWLPSELT
jgi:hypothetical protein